MGRVVRALALSLLPAAALAGEYSKEQAELWRLVLAAQAAGEKAAVAGQHTTAVAKYKDIGVRVEDAYLLSEGGLVRLSAQVPRTLEEIESFIAGRD